MTLSIDGRDYVVISDQSEEYLVRLGLFVDRHIREVRDGFPTISTTDAAVLAALNIADEHLRMQDEQDALPQFIEDTTENILDTSSILDKDDMFSPQTKW